MSKIKKIFLPILFGVLYLNSRPIFSQNVKSAVVEYQQKMVIDESKMANFPESIKEKIRAKSKWKPAILIHNENGSYYILQDKVEAKTTQISFSRKVISIPANKIYFKDFVTNNSYEQINMYNEVVVIKDVLNKYKWKLESEIKAIDNINCKKATTTNSKGTKMTAWYTDKFGINNGPGDYYGLPGLIVYAEGETYSYKLSKVNFSDKEVTLLKPDKNGTQVTQEEYMNLYVNSEDKETKKGNRKTTRRSVKAKN